MSLKLFPCPHMSNISIPPTVCVRVTLNLIIMNFCRHLLVPKLISSKYLEALDAHLWLVGQSASLRQHTLDNSMTEDKTKADKRVFYNHSCHWTVYRVNFTDCFYLRKGQDISQKNDENNFLSQKSIHGS